MIIRRPSFECTLQVLRAHAATPAEFDLLATADYVTDEHLCAGWARRADGSWGRCEECAQPWPCPAWVAVETACIEWLISRSSLTCRAIREHVKREDRKEPA